MGCDLLGQVSSEFGPLFFIKFPNPLFFKHYKLILCCPRFLQFPWPPAVMCLGWRVQLAKFLGLENTWTVACPSLVGMIKNIACSEKLYNEYLKLKSMELSYGIGQVGFYLLLGLLVNSSEMVLCPLRKGTVFLTIRNGFLRKS